METLPGPIRCKICGHSADIHRFASPTPACAACPDFECVPAEAAPPLPEIPERTIREVFTETVCGHAEYEVPLAADLAWQLVLDAWRVIDVASARASVPAAPTRDEWMAALRLAAFRVEREWES